MFESDFAYNINLSSGDSLELHGDFFNFFISDNKNNIKLFDIKYG